MYNKLFTKILDSSIWLEPTPTRIVWLTFIAVMDEFGFAQFASVGNVAHRARVTLEEAEVAIQCFEGPDKDSSDPDNDGQRLERVPGGWMVLNAAKHRDMVTRAIITEQTRERVRRHRERKRNSNASVTTSDTDTDTETRAKEERERTLAQSVNTSQQPSTNVNNGSGPVKQEPRDEQWLSFQQAYPGTKRSGGYMENQAFLVACDEIKGGFPSLMAKLEAHKQSKDWREGFVPAMKKYLGDKLWTQEPDTPQTNNDAARAHLKELERRRAEKR